MSTFSEINNGLIKAVANMSIGLPIAYENVDFNPSGSPYCRMTVIPNPVVYSTLGEMGCDYHDGILQIDIVYPTNSGIADILTKADLVNAYFYPTRVFSQTNLNIRIDQCSTNGRIVNNGWCFQPITIEWFAYSERITVWS